MEAEPAPYDDGEPAPALYSLYAAVDRKVFGTASPLIRPPGEGEIPDAFEQGELVLDAKRVALRSSADVDAIRPFDLDAVLAFAPVAPGMPPPRVARWGIWSFAFDDGFREVMEHDPVTSAALEITLDGVDHPVPVRQGFVTTDVYSADRNRNNVRWTASGFVTPVLRDIHTGRVRSPDDLVRDRVVLPSSDGRVRPPANARTSALLVRHGARLVADRVRRKASPERWVLAYHAGSGAAPLHRFTPLVPPHPGQWADPFPVVHDGETYLFFEELVPGAQHAHISVMTLGADGGWGEPVVVLRADHHLSYPNVFRWEGAFYMIPETEALGRVLLFRSTEFPYRWELDGVLLDGIRAVDTTVAEIDGRWWMFLNGAQEGARTWDELHLYSAAVPTGPWSPHRGNPVRCDARNTRPAGRVVDWHGRLLRPAQDCGGTYGRAIVVNEILALDDDRFEEREVGRIEPDWGPDVLRVHTYNAVPGLTVIDYLRREARRRRRPPA
ncbi:MAG: hypothetical protein M3326_10495 [Actinomycetota bacterium]|nr:hypothetical protein [Actinomycetota bacterium]